MLIHGGDGITAFWLTIDRESQRWISITELSDEDAEMVEKFGEPWINFLRAANRPGGNALILDYTP